MIRIDPCPRRDSSVFDLVRRSLPTAAAERLIAQWDWKYDANPFNEADRAHAFVLRAGDRTVSLLGILRLPLKVGRQECWAAQLGDWIVDPEFRRRHLWEDFSAFGDLTSAPVGLGWAHSISKAATAGHDWVVDRIHPLIRVLDVGRLCELATGSPLLGRVAAMATAPGRTIGATRRRLRRSDVAIVTVPSFDERADRLWTRVSAACECAIVRKHPYLNWRFVARPDVSYTRFVAERGPGMAGYLITRTAERAGLRWGYLVDFFTDDAAALSALVDAALIDFRRNGASVVSCYATAPEVRRVLHWRGFVSFRRAREAYFVHRVVSPDPELLPVKDLRRWFLTMGDGDVEMSF
jgi:hypothetical protein